MPRAAPARADISGHFHAFERVILVSGPQTFRKGLPRDPLGAEVTPWCKGEKPERGQS